MKLTTGILAILLTVGGSAAPKLWGQNPDAIDNARSVAKSLQQKQANDSNAALDAAGVPAAPAASKPEPGAPAPAVKPAVIPGEEKPIVLASTPAAKLAPKAPKAAAPKAAKPAAAASGQHNQLQRVNVVPGSDDIQIEISSSQAVTPNVSKLSSPARVVVELPETIVACAQNKIPVGSGGVKGVRIGMDGKNPPTTSVVVDLEKALAYDVAPGPAGKVTLILHTQGGAPAVAKSAPAPAKPAPAKPAVAKTPETKVAVAKAPAPKAAAPKSEPKKQEAKAAAPAKSVTAAAAAPAPASVKPAEPVKPKAEEKKWAMNGKRDPFFSPVVQQNGSGCSTGKKCLEINAINLRGVVKSDAGFIAVVTNNIGKAYFLRENDPVFNGYVVKITGDSVVFQETIQDKLGKTSTHEVTKRIFTPAV
ncbi:MAG TPA: AMIN domain-containing protein [Candidatus Dormibacteraeota bacterium]|nr:AMIN domain-containing protein [Candidatus Dormibacteraeota bacterium]